MTVETSISVGNLMTIFAMVVLWVITLTVAWTKFGGRMDMLELRIKLMEDGLLKISNVLEKFSGNEREVALLKQEVAALQTDYSILNQTVEGLRRGEGYIQLRMRATVDSEYP